MTTSFRAENSTLISMNEALHALYVSRQADFDSIINQFEGTDLAGPLLMSPNDLYSQQKSPLLIVGQETNTWGYLQGDAIRKQMAFYEEFNVGEKYYASPFWNVTRKVEQTLGNSPYSCAWTNISKFDVEGGRSSGEQEQIISTVDDLLVTEISLIKPKVCLFFSGPAFEARLQAAFPGVVYHPIANWTKQKLARLEHPALPTNTFRTYHPNYLRRSGLESDFLKFIAEVKSAM